MEPEGLGGVCSACCAWDTSAGCGVSAVSVFSKGVGVEFKSRPGIFGNDGSSSTIPTGETTASSLRLGEGSAMVVWNGPVGRATWI